ncbi:MAG: hypothetical protein LBJ67_08475 [Planctomycetaceae bacterium]|nr:hypothetical protein [Planctomycetaceae bacterium]
MTVGKLLFHRAMKLSGTILFFFLPFVGLSVNAQEWRIWMDITGKFSVEAKLLKSDEKQAELEKKDGRVVTLSIDKLSSKDRLYIQQQQAAEKENPFAGGTSVSGKLPQTTLRTPPSDSASIDSAKVREGSPANAKKVLAGSVNGWHYKPQPVAFSGEKVGYKPTVMTTQKNSVSLYEALDIVKGKDGVYAVAAYDDHKQKKTIVHYINATTGKATNHLLPYKGKIWGLSPDGKILLATYNEFDDKTAKHRVDFFRFDNEQLTPFTALIPYADSEHDYQRDVKWAAWVTQGHILTLGQNHNLRLWDIKTAKAVYTMTVGVGEIQLSNDRQVMIYQTKSGFGISETATGKTLGVIPYKEQPLGVRYDFSPDNTKLLIAIHGKLNTAQGRVEGFGEQAHVLSIWDLTTGNKIGEVNVDPTPTNPYWVDNRMILKGNTLYDTETGIPVCYYQGHYSRGRSFDGLFWYLLNGSFGSGESVLAFAKLPQQAALDAIKKIKVTDKFALYPGVNVSVKIETDGSAKEADIRKKLEENLKACGFVVKNDAKVQFIAKVSKAAEGDVAYGSPSEFPFAPSPFRRGPEVEVKITAYASELRITNNDKAFWGARILAVPERIEFSKDKSIQETADELCTPDLDFFAKTQIPRYHNGEPPAKKTIPVVENTAALIQAELTVNGVRER